MTQVTHYFTFGQAHMTNYPLPNGGRLTDYWVEVELPSDYGESHREVFIREFTSVYCPRPEQFSMEYTKESFEPDYFPDGCLHRIQYVHAKDERGAEPENRLGDCFLCGKPRPSHAEQLYDPNYCRC